MCETGITLHVVSARQVYQFLYNGAASNFVVMRAIKEISTFNGMIICTTMS